MPNARGAWVVFVVILGGCGDGNNNNNSNMKREYFYYGTNTTRTPGGMTVGMGETLLHRTFDPPANRIYEDVTAKDPMMGVQENDLVFTVTGSTFVISGGLTGTGTLTGAPWSWTSWTAMGTQNGLDIKSVSTIDPQAVNVKLDLSSGGTLMLTITQDLKAVTQAEWAQRRSVWSQGTFDGGTGD